MTGKYIKKKEKLAKIDLQQENIPDFCKKKPIGPTVKSSQFKPRFPINSRNPHFNHKFKEDDIMGISFDK